ncbi:MAG: efflux RND transporter periplasmic adaptor subunit [Paracoccaceae bacterium]
MKKLYQFMLVFIREAAWIAVAIACVYGGYRGYQYLGENRQIVEIQPIERPVALVETMEVAVFDKPLPVRSEGFVSPYRQVSVSAQSGGRISNLHPSIINLGTFLEGEVLVQLDDGSERALLNQTAANVQATQARLSLVEAQLRRTEELQSRGFASQQALDQLLSQKAELSASLNSLMAAQKSASIAVESKQIIAPFSGAVLEKLQEVGSVVASGQSIAEIYTNNQMEVVIPVREAEAALVPGMFEGSTAKARVNVGFAGQIYQWSAHVSRVDPALDPRTRTLSVSIGLDNVGKPALLNPNSTSFGNMPALINAFAKVQIDGIEQENTYAIPSTAIRSGNKIWVFEVVEQDRGKLLSVDVRPIHFDGETTYVVVNNWPTRTRLILTSLAAPVPGMPLRDLTVEETEMAAVVLGE